jgi:hypothetical protein
MSGLAAHPNKPNKRMSRSTGQRKEIAYMVQSYLEKKKNKHFSPY